MANRYLAGFDDHDTTSLVAYELGVNSVATVAAGGRTGTNCLRFTTSARYAYIVTTPEGVATFHFGFAFKMSALPGSIGAFFNVADFTNTHLILAVTSSGNLRWIRYGSPQLSTTSVTGTTLVTGATTLSTGTYYWISGSLTIDNSAGAITTYINGTADANINGLTGLDTQNAGTANIVQVGFSGVEVGNTDFDDVVINDSSGSSNNTVPADSRVDCHMPDANGNSSSWTRSTGANQYATIDEVAANGDTDYNSTSTLNAVDTVGIEAFKNSGATIDAVQVNWIARKTDSGTCGISPVLRINATDNVGTQKNPGTTYGSARQNYDVQPDTTAWDETDFNAMEAGYKKVA